LGTTDNQRTLHKEVTTWPSGLIIDLGTIVVL